MLELCATYLIRTIGLLLSTTNSQLKNIFVATLSKNTKAYLEISDVIVKNSKF